MTSQPIICAVCQEALNVHVGPDGVTYRHAAFDPDAHEDDHEPIPTTAAPDWRGRCDFCSNQPPSHVLPAQDFRVPGMEWHTSAGDWAACDDCTALLYADDWDGLYVRVVEFFARVHGVVMSPHAQRHLRELYRRLRGVVTVPPVPLPTKET